MSIQFLRRARVQVGLPGSQGREFKNGIRFEIEKDEKPKSNKAEIGLYNISAQSMSWLETKDSIIRLFTGYGNFDEQTFIGNIVLPISRYREGNDVITMFGAGDSESTLNTATIEVSLKKGETIEPLISQAREALGVSLGPIRGDLNKPLSRGYSFSGTVRDLLNEITADAGLTWSIQDNELQIYPKKDRIRTQAVVISPETGLLGDLAKSEKLIVGRALLNPKIRPGRVILLRSKNFSGLINSFGGRDGQGFFKVKRVRHTGDTEKLRWDSIFEGERIDATVDSP